MDFVSDALATGRRFRCLTTGDEGTRASPDIFTDTSISGVRVTRVLDELKETRGLPKVIVVDNGPEFTSKAMHRWARANGVRLRFVDPGKPTQNAYVESFNGKLRDTCLDLHWFVDLDDARTTVEARRRDYDEVGPHGALGRTSPAISAQRLMGTSPAVETEEFAARIPPFPQRCCQENPPSQTGSENGSSRARSTRTTSDGRAPTRSRSGGAEASTRTTRASTRARPRSPRIGRHSSRWSSPRTLSRRCRPERRAARRGAGWKGGERSRGPACLRRRTASGGTTSPARRRRGGRRRPDERDDEKGRLPAEEETAARQAPSRLTVAAVDISSSRSAIAALPLIANGSRTAVSENLRTVPRFTRFSRTFPIRHVAKRRSAISA